MGITLTNRSTARCPTCGKRQELPTVTDTGQASISWACVRDICGETLTVHRQTGLTPFGPFTVWLQAGEKPDIQAVSDDCAPLPPK